MLWLTNNLATNFNLFIPLQLDNKPHESTDFVWFCDVIPVPLMELSTRS